MKRFWPLLLLAGLAACEDSSDPVPSFVLNPVVPNLDGANGCNGLGVSFSPPPAPEEIVLSAVNLGFRSRLAASTSEEKLYVTGTDATFGATVVEVDLTDLAGVGPVESVVVDPAAFSTLLTAEGILTPAQISGVAILMAGGGGAFPTLAVMEHTSNALFAFDAATGLFHLAGVMDTAGDYSDPTDASFARFDFQEPGDLCADAEGRIFIADTGNDRVRLYTPGTVDVVSTVAGTGIATSIDGDFETASYDTPWGLSVTCDGHLLITESGDSGGGGNRLRTVMIGVGTSFVSLEIDAFTLAGNGFPATLEGDGELASLARPSPPVTAADGRVYWVDTLTGVLRRYDPASGAVDCPLATDCASAVASPTFSSSGGNVSLAISSFGDLYVLDGGSARLWRIPAP